MKKILFTLCISSLFYTAGLSQKPARSIFGEAGGPGLASLNFDTRFSKSEKGLGGRIGVGGFSVNAIPATFIPVELNFLAGKKGSHYFEAGAGITFVSLSEKIIFGQGATDNTRFKNTFEHFSIGYRFQPPKGGFLFKIALTPLFNRNFFIPYYFGVGAGYKF